MSKLLIMWRNDAKLDIVVRCAICGPIFLGSPPARPLLPILQPERLPHHRLRIHSVCWQWKHTPCASDTGSRKVIFFLPKISRQFVQDLFLTVCDETQKLNKTESKTFFPIPIFFDTESDTFSNTNFFLKPTPILFSIPKFSETDTNPFFDNKIFWNRYRYFFRYQNFQKPIPIL